MFLVRRIPDSSRFIKNNIFAPEFGGGGHSRDKQGTPVIVFDEIAGHRATVKPQGGAFSCWRGTPVIVFDEIAGQEMRRGELHRRPAGFPSKKYTMIPAP